ncbi:MAG TPA: restriction endonuclease subunit S [Accumulibacter sp.]|nr:restriction endonuclease subunit S [Accumulibacter sp.]
MIADLKPYAEYKESGLSWLGQVPGHWELRRMKSAVMNVIEQRYDLGPDEVYVALEHVESWTGKARPQSDSSLFSGQVKRFRKGDVLFGKLRPYLAKVTRINKDGVCAGEFFVLRPTDSAVSSAYLEHQLRAKHTIDVINGSTFGAKMPRADWQFCGNLPFLLPTPAEQAAIVRFLDWANGRLERAIRAKRKVIALLNEQKQAIIHRAVTRGLDPSVPLKPSGIPWLGDIPQHWEVVRNMSLFAHRVEAGIAGLPVLQVSLRSGVTAEDLDPFGRPKRLIADPTKYKLVRTSDMAYNTMRMWQGAVGVAPNDGLVSPAYVVLTPRQDTCPDFYDYVFHTDVYKQQVNRQSTGIVSDRNRLYWDSFKQMPNIALARLEQETIVRFIHSETGTLIAATARLQREIDLLREYRTRLVADVVTGKLDVREAAARLPDEAPLATDYGTDPSLDSEAADEESVA